jgi:hypothetical protein
VVDDHFKPNKPEKKLPINPTDSAFSLKMTDANWKKFIPPLDYDCSITKSYEKKRNLLGRCLMFHSSEPKEAINGTDRHATNRITTANCFSGHLGSLGGSGCRA